MASRFLEQMAAQDQARKKNQTIPGIISAKNIQTEPSITPGNRTTDVSVSAASGQQTDITAIAADVRRRIGIGRKKYSAPEEPPRLSLPELPATEEESGGLLQRITDFLSPYTDILSPYTYSGDSSLPMNAATQEIGAIRNNPEAVEKALADRETLDAKKQEKAAQTAAWAKEHPFLASAGSVFTSPLSSADYLQRLVEMNAIGQTLPREELMPGEVTQTLRSGASEDMGTVGKFLYNTGMSAVDSLTASQLGGGVPGMGGAILAGGAAASAANDIRDRGGTDEQALIGGAVSGIFESLFESLSIGELDALKEAPVDGVKTLLKNLAKNTLTNASEEAATELANTIFDSLYMKELSNYTENVKAAMAAGMSEQEARAYAMKAAAAEIGLSALSGGLMGVGMGAAGSAVGVLSSGQAQSAWLTSQTDKAQNNAYQTMAEKGLFSPEAQAAAKNAVAQMDQARRRSGLPWNFQDEVMAQLTGQDTQGGAKTGQEGQGTGGGAEEAAPTEPLPESKKNGSDVNTDSDAAEEGKPRNNATDYTDMLTRRLLRMGEDAETAQRLGGLLGRAAEGGSLTAAEWTEVQNNPTAAQMVEPVRMIAERDAQNDTGGTTYAERRQTDVHLSDGRGERGSDPDSGRPAEAVQSGQTEWNAQSQRGGQTADAGTAEKAVEPAQPQRLSGRSTQNLRAIERSDAVRESGATLISTRKYMGLDIGTERPCLLEAPEEVIRSDRVLSEVYDEIWEMGYKPHLFAGKPETENAGFDFNGAVRGDEVFVRIDHARYDADAIWAHEKYHILSSEDPGLRSQTRDLLLEKYGEAELLEKLGTYWERYAGAYGLPDLQGEYNLSDSELLMILEELLADAYAGKDTFRTGAADYQEDVREAARGREGQNPAVRGPPETQYSIGYDQNNRPFVTVEEDILEGVPREDWVRTVKDNLRKKFPNGVTVGNSQIKINKRSRGEMTFSRYMRQLLRSDPQKYADKLRATNNSDEILRAATGWVNEALLHPRQDAVIDFARGNVQLRIGGRDYTAQVIVGNMGRDGLLLYDVIELDPTKIQTKTNKANPGDTANPINGTGSRQPESAYDSTISQSDQDVKPLSLPTLESTDGEERARFSMDEEEQPTRVPAEQRRAAVRKLSDDLSELFPETGKSYLRNLADEIRSGADEAKLDTLFQEAYDSAKVYDESPETVELREIAREIRGRRIYADQSLKEEFGDGWKSMRQFLFGKGIYLTNDRSDEGLDQLNAELSSRYGGWFDANETDMAKVISRLEYILRRSGTRQITLDEQARQYGGEEAAEQFRNAYRQKFMDAVEGYRDTMRGLDDAQRTAREEARLRQRQELEDYVSHAREILRDRAAQGMGTGKTNPKGLPPEGVDIDEYVQSLEQRAAEAREERLRTVPREEFRGSEAMEKLGIRITGSVTDQYRNAAQLRQRQSAAEQARKAIRRAEKRLNATEAEKAFASGITSGIYTENDIPRTMDADRVMELADYYMGERAFGLDLLRQQKEDISRGQQEKAKAILGPALETSEGKEKLTGKAGALLGDAFVLNNRTAERNMRSIFGDEAGERINQWLFAPVAENEGERYRFVNRMLDQVREIEGRDGKKKELTKVESALVQKVIEGRAAEEITAGMEMGESIRNAAENLISGGDITDIAREYNLDKSGRKLARQYAAWLEVQEELKTADTVKIENAVRLYSDLYGQFYEAINDFLTVHGYEPVGFIKGYAPHMQAEDTISKVQRAFQTLGVGADAAALPTSIAGETKDFKPGKRWNPFFQERTGENTDYDIVGGFEQYVDYLSDVLYHTDDIARIREANKFLRQTYAPEEIRENISRAEELKYRKPEEKRAFLIDQGELDSNSSLSAADLERKMSEYADRLYESVQNTTQYGQLAVWMDDYANKLAGKQLFADRDMERTFGRTSLNIGNKLNRLFTRAQVSGNLSSVLNQTSQLPIIQAELGTKYTVRAMKDNWNGRLRRGDWAQSSDFLTEKNGLNYITTSPAEMITGALFQPLDFVDGYLSTLAVRGKYLQEIDRGQSHEEAMRSADRFGREVMGSRAKGSAPLAFQEKSIFSRMLHTFQLEALNTWEHLSQDLPRDFREIEKTQGKAKASRAAAALAVKVLLGNFLLNRTAELLYGGTPAQGDVLGIAANFVATGMGTTVNSMLAALLNAGFEKLTGKKLFDDDDDQEEQSFDLGEALKAAGSDILNDAPMVQNMGALFGIGDLSLPMPDVAQGVKRTAAAWKEDGGFSWEVARQLMGLAGDVAPGGRQAEKTFQGLDTALRGGRYSGYGEGERLMYPISQDPFTALKAAVFGNSALEENSQYYASGETALSEKQTKLYQEMVQGGADRQEVYSAILDWRHIQNDADLTGEEKARLGEDIVSRTELTDRQKLRFYEGLTGAESRAEKLGVLLDAGMNWDHAIAAYAQYDDIREKDLTAAQKAAELARWADINYPRKQADAVKEQFKYYSMVPAQAGRYEKLTGTGLDADTAYRLTEVLGQLEPQPGKAAVSTTQKAKAVITAGLSESDQLAALEAVLGESEYRKVQAGYEQGVSPAQYVEAREAIAAVDDGNGTISQDEATKAIKGMSGLTKEQKAALWQMQNKSWTAESNPFSVKTGKQVKKALEQGVSESDTYLEGLKLPEVPRSGR